MKTHTNSELKLINVDAESKSEGMIKITHNVLEFQSIFINFYKCSASLDKVIPLRKVGLQAPLLSE